MVKVLDKGFVELIRSMPSVSEMELEKSIVDAARVSCGNDNLNPKMNAADKRLLLRLYRDEHTSPFEMVVFQFKVKAPLFVARQWFRHRMSSYNEQSGRYSVLKDEFYVPDKVRMQHTTNKQMSSDQVADEELTDKFNDYIGFALSQYERYEELCKLGVSRELARIGLSVNIYTTFVWKIDLHNLLRFLLLRMAPDAQYEIREYAFEIFNIISPLCPNICDEFQKKYNFQRNDF